MEDLELQEASWKDYRRFVEFCCVPTLPFQSGKCWTVKGDKAFIGYNHPYRFNHCRNVEFEQILTKHRYIPINWLNDNVRLLNRVMVRPQYRGRGIATQLVKQTLPMLGVTYVECLTFAELIMGVLHRCGFVQRGLSLKKTCQYWIWANPHPGNLRLLGTVHECHQQVQCYRQCRKRSQAERRNDVLAYSLRELGSTFEFCADVFRAVDEPSRRQSALEFGRATRMQSSGSLRRNLKSS